MMNLYPHQVDGVNMLRDSWYRGKRRPLLVFPVGSGKTVMFSYFSSEVAKKGKRTLILAHRNELLDQVSETLGKFDVRHTFIAADRYYDYRVNTHVGSVFTVAKRLDSLPEYDVIIVDEAHHSTLNTTWGKILARYPKAFVIGVTATAWRLSGESLGDIYDDLIVGPSVADLIARGFLSPYRLYAPGSIDDSKVRSVAGDYNKAQLERVSNRPSITGDAIKHYRKHADQKRAVAFCVTLAHAQSVCAKFNAAGVRSEIIDGTMEREARRSLVNRFKSGETTLMVSVDVVSEGFDLPAIECVISLRKTKSLSLWIQQTGRGLRKLEGKKEAIILDHAGNSLMHGLPDDPRTWSLVGEEPGRSRSDSSDAVRVCPSCFAAQRPGTDECIYCGAPFEIRARKITESDEELVEVDVSKARAKWSRMKEQQQAKTFDQLVALGKERHYPKPYGWAKRVWDARQAKRIRGKAV